MFTKMSTALLVAVKTDKLLNLKDERDQNLQRFNRINLALKSS